MSRTNSALTLLFGLERVRDYGPWYYRMHNWIAQHPLVVIAGHVCVTGLLLETGINRLEPLAVNWFWAPILATVLTPRDADGAFTRFGRWAIRHRLAIWVVGWAINAIVIPAMFWDFFKSIDVFTHALREAIGRVLGLGGQSGLVYLLCGLAIVWAVIAEVYMVRTRE